MGHPMKRRSSKIPRVKMDYVPPMDGALIVPVVPPSVPLPPFKKMRGDDCGSDKRRLCWYCGIQTVPAGQVPGLLADWRESGTSHPPNLRTRDHVTPRSRGGKGDATVKVVACAECNESKRNMTLAEYREVCNPDDGLFFFERSGWSLPEPVRKPCTRAKNDARRRT